MESSFASNLPHKMICTGKATLKNGDLLIIDGHEFKFHYEGHNCILHWKFARENMNFVIKFIKPIKKKPVKKRNIKELTKKKK